MCHVSDEKRHHRARTGINERKRENASWQGRRSSDIVPRESSRRYDTPNERADRTLSRSVEIDRHAYFSRQQPRFKRWNSIERSNARRILGIVEQARRVARVVFVPIGPIVLPTVLPIVLPIGLPSSASRNRLNRRTRVEAIDVPQFALS